MMLASKSDLNFGERTQKSQFAAKSWAQEMKVDNSSICVDSGVGIEKLQIGTDGNITIMICDINCGSISCNDEKSGVNCADNNDQVIPLKSIFAHLNSNFPTGSGDMENNLKGLREKVNFENYVTTERELGTLKSKIKPMKIKYIMPTTRPTTINLSPISLLNRPANPSNQNTLQSWATISSRNKSLKYIPHMEPHNSSFTLGNC